MRDVSVEATINPAWCGFRIRLTISGASVRAQVRLLLPREREHDPRVAGA